MFSEVWRIYSRLAVLELVGFRCIWHEVSDCAVVSAISLNYIIENAFVQLFFKLRLRKTIVLKRTLKAWEKTIRNACSLHLATLRLGPTTTLCQDFVLQLHVHWPTTRGELKSTGARVSLNYTRSRNHATWPTVKGRVNGSVNNFMFNVHACKKFIT